MQDTLSSARRAPVDQAHGLRRLFAGSGVRHIALVANPHVGFASVVIERLTSALGEAGLNTLIVDAADSSPAPHELAAIDLGACIERLSPAVSYLAARGLPRRHVDTRGSSAVLLDRLASAAPQVQVMLVHAGASDLARLYPALPLRPVLLAADQPDSVTHAYAAMKLLVQRCALMSYDLLLAAPPHGARNLRIAERLGSCAENFLGAALHDWVAVDPASDVRDAPGAGLAQLVREQLSVGAACDEALVPGWPMAASASRPMALNLN
jgi:flagellar biosynthesis protein FlhG